MPTREQITSFHEDPPPAGVVTDDLPACHLHVFGPDSPELVKHRVFRQWLTVDVADRELYARTKRDASAASTAAGEHGMQYNARKEQVVREIYQRAFAAAGLLDPAAT